MKILYSCFGVFALLSLTLTSCGDSSQTEQKETEAAPEAETVSNACTYSYFADSTNFRWTAYKFTEKTGVGGTFDKISVTGTQSADNIREVFKYATFSIPINSINSADPERDRKVAEHFFGTMNDTENLEGNVINIGDKSADIAIKMNGVTDTLTFDMNTDGERISLESVLQLADWKAMPSVDKLNEICHDLHIGADGVSKLWPEVKLELSTVVQKKCD